MSDNNELQVNQVTLQIGDKTILNNISLSVKPGEVLSVLGPNGAGKTSLLKVLSGQRQCQGDVTWRQQSIREFSIQSLAQQIAVVNQVNDVVFSVTVLQVVRMGLLPHMRLLSRQTEAHDQRIDKAMQAVGLDDKRSQLFSSLSGGEQQRALIARALVQGSPLLVLDEPVNHLDVFYQHQILQLLRDLAKALNVTVVMSLHDLNLAAHYSDQVALLSEGELVACGSPDAVLQSHMLTQVFGLECDVEQRDGSVNVTFRPAQHKVLDLSGWSQ